MAMVLKALLPPPRGVAVGSTNPVKVNAVENVFEKVCGRRVRVVSVRVSSGVPRQPMGVQAIDGAVNRAREALNTPNVELGVGIEAGYFPFPHTISGYLDIQWCAVVDQTGRITVGCNAGFEPPPRVVKKVLMEKKEMGEVMEEITGIRNIGETIGAIGWLTKGLLNRTQLTEQAVLMALIPRINEKEYFG